jgi:hypothetical protein
MAATLRIASEKARLGQPEVKLGLIPGYGGSQRLPRLVGKGAALKMLLTGEMISAAEALRLGLVDEVVAPDALLPRAESLAAAIAAMAPLAVRHCIDVVNAGYDLPLDAALAHEAALFGICCGTEYLLCVLRSTHTVRRWERGGRTCEPAMANPMLIRNQAEADILWLLASPHLAIHESTSRLSTPVPGPFAGAGRRLLPRQPQHRSRSSADARCPAQGASQR